jgi:hypothetical protein
MPEDVHRIGVPSARTGYNAFVLSAAAVVALLALIFTLSWVVYHQLQSAGDHRAPRQNQPSQTVETTPQPTPTE